MITNPPRLVREQWERVGSASPQAPERPWASATPEEALRRVRTPETPVTGPPVVLISLYDGQMNTSLRTLYAQLTGNGHLTKIIRFGVTVPYRRNLDYAVFQTVKVKFPLARHRATDEEIDGLVTKIVELQPLWIGFNIIAPHNQLAARVTARLRQSLSVVPVVWGGYMAINEPEWCLAQGGADAACVGEGEQVVLEITERLKNGRPDLSGIAGLWTKDALGQVQQAPRRGLLTAEQLEAIPMVYFERTADEIHLPENALEHYRNLPQCDGGKANSATVVHDILFTRGCFFRCTFCHHNVQIVRERGQGTYYRPPSPEWVVEQCKDAKHRLKKHRFLIWDDIFPFDVDWVRRFSKLYREEIGLPFSINFHHKLIHEEVVDLLIEAGMDSANVGIQSGSERVRRDLYGRMETNEEVLRNAALLHPRVYICYDLIIDNPLESVEDLRDGLELWMQMPYPFILDTNTLLFFRNQDITNRALREGHITEADLLGQRPDKLFEDVTCSPYTPRVGAEKRALTMLTIACQNSFIPRDLIREWSHDPELLADDRLMALKVLERLYFHARERMFEYEWTMMDFFYRIHPEKRPGSHTPTATGA